MTATFPVGPRLKPREKLGLLSLVIPVFNERDMLPILRARLDEWMGKQPHAVEVVLVDDGSTDGTVHGLAAWAEDCPAVKMVALSRNFGHQIATTAGLRYARGDAVVIMDADLQDPPEVIPQMVAGYLAGYDVVYAQRTSREGESAFKQVTAKLFYWLMRTLVTPDLPADTGDFRLMSRRVTDHLVALKERERFLRGLVTWAGFPQTAIQYERAARAAGHTKYPLAKMVRFAMNAMVSFSDLPLRVIMGLGVLCILVSFAYILRTVYLYWWSAVPLVPGWASHSILICFFSGIILLAQGMIGMYVGRIYTEVKERPLYLVAETLNVDQTTMPPENRP